MSGIEIAGLVLALPGIVQIFLGTGEMIYERMKDDKRMKDYAQDLRKFIIDDGRAQLNRDFELARGVLKDQNIRNDEKERIYRLFNRALEQLQQISHLMDVVLNSETLDFRKRSKALRDIKDTITDIRISISEFSQLVLSLHTITTSEPPLLLEDQDFVLIGPEEGYDSLNNTTFLARGRVSRWLSTATTADDDRFLVECKPYTTHTMRSIKKGLRILSQKLSAADKQNGILPLVGFRDNPSKNEYQLVFSIPSGEGFMHTLDRMYDRQQPSLNCRIHLCSQLARAVLQAHTLGLVHKHIRPENVLWLSLTHEPIPIIFLSGWQYARNVDGGVTRLAGESLWQRAIYQHPERQSEHVEEEYCMGHDIYSLGVCMLELLTWDPLVITPENGMQEPSISQSYRTVLDQYEPREGNQEVYLNVESLIEDPQIVQRTLLHMCDRMIPAAAGDRMKDLVCQCLTCLDIDASLGSFKVFQGREDKDIAVGFVDTVLKDIRRVMNAI